MSLACARQIVLLSIYLFNKGILYLFKGIYADIIDKLV